MLFGSIFNNKSVLRIACVAIQFSFYKKKKKIYRGVFEVELLANHDDVTVVMAIFFFSHWTLIGFVVIQQTKKQSTNEPINWKAQ